MTEPIAKPPKRRGPAAAAKIFASGVALAATLLIIGILQMRAGTGVKDAAVAIEQAPIAPAPVQTVIVIYRNAPGGKGTPSVVSAAPPAPAPQKPVVIRRVVHRTAHTVSKAS